MNPFAENSTDSVASLGEAALIERIRQWLGPANPPEPAGIGDDCAVFTPTRAGCELLITTDPVIYGSHFDDSLSPAQAAAKLVKRNLSDIAAMGGLPTLATVSLALDPRVSIAWIEAFYRELARYAEAYRFAIAGGDISSAAQGFVGAFLTLVGETQPEIRPLRRHQATIGCPIYVTGQLGGTRLSKHATFEPRLAEGQWLARQPACIACTDVSDGLGKDYANILAPGLGVAEIDSRRLPIAPDAATAAAASGKSELHHVFNDGEDFELLFALAPHADGEAFEAAWAGSFRTPLTRIGIVVTRPEKCGSSGSRLHLLHADTSESLSGYEHLK